MTQEEQAWPSIPDDEMDAFYQTADLFLNAANQLLAEEIPARAGAAFLYACARFNGFALQVQIEQVRQLGFNHLALPLLALEDLLARTLVKHRPLFAKVHLRSMDVCLELNLHNGVAFHQRLADYRMTRDEQALYASNVLPYVDSMLTNDVVTGVGSRWRCGRSASCRWRRRSST